VILLSFPCSNCTDVHFSYRNYSLIVLFSEIIGDLVLSRSLASLWRAIREEHTNDAGGHSEYFSVFHILDSLRDNSWPATEGKQLQTILLKHFDGTAFMEGRIATNFAQVISYIYTSLLHLSHVEGSSPSKFEGLWLLRDLFRKKVFFKP
jgi:hypothetical protein